MNFRGLMNRKGQGLSVNAIILIILGLVVLVMLILGFVFGWSKILPFVSTNNVDYLKTACSTACAVSEDFNFCNTKRELKSDDGTLKDVTCNYLVQKEPKYNIESCSQISCNNIVFVELSTGETFDNSKCAGNVGKTVQSFVGDTLKT